MNILKSLKKIQKKYDVIVIGGGHAGIFVINNQ